MGFIKASKKNKTRRTSCLKKVTKYYGIKYCDRFAYLNYLCLSQTFYKKVITVVKQQQMPSAIRLPFKKLIIL